MDLKVQDKNLIIGITGAFGSGKSTAASFFETKGFNKIVLSEFLEEEALRRGAEPTRKVLQDIGNEWREKFGSFVLSQKALEKVKEDNLENVVIDGIRNVLEIEFLKKNTNFTLIAIVSDKKNRFERLKELKRREDMTWELFEKLDDRDRGIGERETGLQVDKCIKLADFLIENNGTENEFNKKLKQFLENYE